MNNLYTSKHVIKTEKKNHQQSNNSTGTFVPEVNNLVFLQVFCKTSEHLPNSSGPFLNSTIIPQTTLQLEMRYKLMAEI